MKDNWIKKKETTKQTAKTEEVVEPVVAVQKETENQVLENTTDTLDASVSDNFSEFISKFQTMLTQFNSLKTELKTLEKMTHYHANSKDFAAAFYKARPLDGIAFAAPYLHNGSVPTLYDFFMIDGPRPQKFPIGTLEYDMKRVGYKTKDVGFFDYGIFEFDTSKGKADLRNNGQVYGNKNTGHSWGTNLTRDDKIALVEFLKSL